MHEALTVEQSDGIATFTITRPRVNALSLDLIESFAEELRNAAADPEVMVAVWRSGLPNIFSAGFDLNDESGPPVAHHMPGERTVRVRNAQTALLDIPIPIIVAVNGPAVGLGLLMPALCDIVVAGRSACFGLPEIQIGAIALVVDDDQLEEETMAIAREITTYDPVVVRNNKISLEMLRGVDDVATVYAIEHKWGAAIRASRE